ncbi:MAG: hypothetical protein RMJ88_07475 [Thermogemmata sp.]|nr:hypothetical protein [Thermogemmata sp.]
MDETVCQETELILSLPLDCLPCSALVDVLHLAAGLKKVMRTKLLNGADETTVISWCTAHSLVGMCDEERYVFIGKTRDAVLQALAIDKSQTPHEMQFGTLLGYPSCCCEAVARIGEAAIDDYAKTVAHWMFPGEYILINPRGYTQGQSLICHLPCSPICEQSLTMAKQALVFLQDKPKLLKKWSDQISFSLLGYGTNNLWY